MFILIIFYVNNSYFNLLCNRNLGVGIIVKNTTHTTNCHFSWTTITTCTSLWGFINTTEIVFRSTLNSNVPILSPIRTPRVPNYPIRPLFWVASISYQSYCMVNRWISCVASCEYSTSIRMEIRGINTDSNGSIVNKCFH